MIIGSKRKQLPEKQSSPVLTDDSQRLASPPNPQVSWEETQSVEEKKSLLEARGLWTQADQI